MMMNHTPLLSIALALLCHATVIAQEPQASPAPVVGECFVSTDAGTWMAIGLSTDQLEKVQSMQTACKTDCAATPERSAADADVSGAVLKRYEGKLQEVLTPDQYAKWKKWCAERPEHM